MSIRETDNQGLGNYDSRGKWPGSCTKAVGFRLSKNVDDTFLPSVGVYVCECICLFAQ